jgi:hypothetical protein
MSAPTITVKARGIFRHSRADALLVALAAVHGLVLIVWPSMPVVAIGVWWNSNTISHNFIHRPFFRSPRLNLLFSWYLSALLGIPQSLWRARHQAHHAGIRRRAQLSPQVMIEVCLVLCLWGTMLATAPAFFLQSYAPGYLIGLALCALHGHYEHARGATVSHYGKLYNLLFFNDGYHIEHHARPGAHWTQLPQRLKPPGPASRWPAVLRWLDALTLDALERWALRSRSLQRFLLKSHEQAFRRLLKEAPDIHRVGIVGGGLFPRTLLILERLLPEAELVIIDASGESIRVAREFVNRPIECINEWYDPMRHDGFDLVVIPLAFIGDRARLYRHPAAPAVIIHDWIWRRQGTGVVVSRVLLKRLNLVKR